MLRLARWFWVVALVLLATGCSVPVIKPGWQDQEGAEIKELRLTVSPGNGVVAAVKFIPGDNDNDGLTVSVGGEPPLWVSVDPPRLPRVDLGVAYPLSVQVRAPADARAGTYEAAVILRSGRKEAGRLPVKITVK